MDRRYSYEFIGSGSGTGQTVPTTPTTGQEVPTTPSAGATAAEGFAKRAGQSVITQTIISPLNSATGGLAAPAYQLGRNLLSGAGSAAVGGAVAGLVFAGVMLAVNKISERMDKLESEAAEANEREVLLLRAGRITQVSTYEANFFSGVQKVNRG